MQLKKNMLIQLFDDQGMISERMVAQTGEFYAGPKEKHKGLMRMMFTLENSKDVEDAIKYLQQLGLDAPLRSSSKVTSKTNPNKDVELDNILEVLLEEAITTAKDNQDKFIQYLRDREFVFLDSDNLLLKIPDTYNVKDRHLKSFQWLIRRSKIAKDPRNDKYDPRLFIGISLFDGRKAKMVVYLYSEMQKKRLLIPIPDNKAITFRKTNLIKYPKWMNEEERLKWGVEHRLLFNNPDKNKSKFYVRWEKDIKVGNELKLKR